MKKSLLIVLFGLVALMTGGVSASSIGGCQDAGGEETRFKLPDAVFDCGGTALDLEAISARRFPVPSGGLSGRAERLKEFDPLQPVILNVDWEKMRRESPGGAHGISLRYRFRYLKRRSGRGVATLVIRGQQTQPDGTRKISQQDWPTYIHETGNQWCEYYLPNVGLRTISDRLELVFDPGDGFGTIEVRDVRPVPFAVDDSADPAKYAIHVRQMAISDLDGVFTLARGVDQPMFFIWRLNDPSARLDTRKLSLKIELPAGVRGLNSIDTVPDDLRPRGEENSWYAPAFHVTTDLPPGASVGDGTVTAWYDGKPCSKPVTVKFAVEEPAVARAVPKRYFNGTCACWAAVNYIPEQVLDAYVRMMYDAGLRGVNGHYPRLAAALEKCGPLLWQSQGLRFIANGFELYMGPKAWDECPPDQRFMALGKDGKIAPQRPAVCPLTISEKKSFFVEKCLPYLRQVAKGTTAAMENWEPNGYFGRGCFCESCLAAFAAWLKRPVADVRTDWPACAREGGRFFAEALKFRAAQHGALMKTINESICEIQGPAACGFCPEVVYTEFTGDVLETPLAAEVATTAYAGSLKWVNPWGPYVWWSADQPYFREKRLPVAAWVSARAVRENIDRNYGPKPPKLVSFPHGFQGTRWVGTPDWLRLCLDSYFFNRWEGSLVYFFPRGYDVRWWRAFAEATTRAGLYEDYVLDGTRADGKTSLRPISSYAAPCRQVSAYLRKHTDVSPLQSATYDLAGARIVAVVNFWEEGAAFFRLKTTGLAPGHYTIVADRETLWAKADCDWLWTDGELANGVFAGVGAARTRVFEISAAEAHAERTAKNLQKVSELEKTCRRLLPDLEKKAARDREEESGRTNLNAYTTPVI